MDPSRSSKRSHQWRINSNFPHHGKFTPCFTLHSYRPIAKHPHTDKRTTPFASKSPSSNLAIIQIPLTPLPMKPILPADYQNSVKFFKSLFRSSSYLTHKFHEFDPRWKRNYATWSHTLEHSHFCKEAYCRYHT